MEDFISDIVKPPSQAAMIFIVIDGSDHIVIFPAPVFIPGQVVPDQCAVMLQGKIRMDVMIVLGVQADTLHHAGHRPTALGSWVSLYCEGELIGDDFPSPFPVKGME